MQASGFAPAAVRRCCVSHQILRGSRPEEVSAPTVTLQQPIYFLLFGKKLLLIELYELVCEITILPSEDAKSWAAVLPC